MSLYLLAFFVAATINFGILIILYPMRAKNVERALHARSTQLLFSTLIIGYSLAINSTLDKLPFNKFLFPIISIFYFLFTFLIYGREEKSQSSYGQQFVELVKVAFRTKQTWITLLILGVFVFLPLLKG